MIGLRRTLEVQQALDHVLNLLLFGTTLANHGELDLAGGELPDFKPALAQATSAAPRAWPVANAAVMFCPNETVSTPTQVGRNRPTTAPIWSWIFSKRCASGIDAGVETHP